MLQKLITRLLRYNLWANERLTAWLLTLDRSILYQQTGSSFGTICRTLQHIHAAQIYWHAIITKDQINEFTLPVKENAAEGMTADLVASSQQLISDLWTLTDQQLIEPIAAADSTQSRYEYIIHVVNHSAYHRGQIVTYAARLAWPEKYP